MHVMKKKIMIFSTRYLNDSEGFIFHKSPFVEDKETVIWKCREEIKENKENFEKVLKKRYLLQNPEMMIEIAKILQKVDPEYDFTLDQDLFDDGYLTTDICDFINENANSLSDEIVTELAPYIFSKNSFGYVQWEEADTDNETTFKAIGIMHLPKGTITTKYHKAWASYLIEHFAKDASGKDDEIYLCLHSGTDYKGEAKDYVAKVKDEFSLPQNVSVFLFHHEPDIYNVAKIMHQKDAKLSTIWEQLTKLKDNGTL